MKTVGDIKKILSDVSDDMIAVFEGSDHSYNNISSVYVEQAEYDPKTHDMWQYFDKGSMCKRSNKVISVLILT